MLKIRFSRTGRKNQAQFRIVVQEHTYAPTGRHVEVLGNWDPHRKEGTFKAERIAHWIDNGAQVSDSVYNLLVSQGVIKGDKRKMNISGKKKEEEGSEEATEEKTEAPAEEKTEEKAEEKEEEKVEEKKESIDKTQDKKEEKK
ncbi:30S ribosomal protein S16 [Patescibacteria group bacterium]